MATLHWCSSQEDLNNLGASKYEYYVLNLSNEPCPKIICDLEVIDFQFPLMFSDFNAMKREGQAEAEVVPSSSLVKLD